MILLKVKLHYYYLKYYNLILILGTESSTNDKGKRIKGIDSNIMVSNSLNSFNFWNRVVQYVLNRQFALQSSNFMIHPVDYNNGLCAIFSACRPVFLIKKGWAWCFIFDFCPMIMKTKRI